MLVQQVAPPNRSPRFVLQSGKFENYANRYLLVIADLHYYLFCKIIKILNIAPKRDHSFLCFARFFPVFAKQRESVSPFSLSKICFVVGSQWVLSVGILKIGIIFFNNTINAFHRLKIGSILLHFRRYLSAFDTEYNTFHVLNYQSGRPVKRLTSNLSPSLSRWWTTPLTINPTMF